MRAARFRTARRSEVQYGWRLIEDEGAAVMSASWRGVTGRARMDIEARTDEASLAAFRDQDWETLRAEALADLEARLDARGWRLEPAAA